MAFTNIRENLRAFEEAGSPIRPENMMDLASLLIQDIYDYNRGVTGVDQAPEVRKADVLALKAKEVLDEALLWKADIEEGQKQLSAFTQRGIRAALQRSEDAQGALAEVQAGLREQARIEAQAAAASGELERKRAELESLRERVQGLQALIASFDRDACERELTEYRQEYRQLYSAVNSGLMDAAPLAEEGGQVEDAGQLRGRIQQMQSQIEDLLRGYGDLLIAMLRIREDCGRQAAARD